MIVMKKLAKKTAALLAAFCLAAIPMTAFGMVRTPIASGSVTYGNDKVTIDASHTDQGYVMIKYTGGNSKIKIQVTKGTTYTYNLNARDTYEVFPLTEAIPSRYLRISAETSMPRPAARTFRYPWKINIPRFYTRTSM